MANEADYHRQQLSQQRDELELKRQALEQGKIQANPITGELYNTIGPDRGKVIENQDGIVGQTKQYADNIGVSLVPAKGRADMKNSSDMITAAGANIAPINDAIVSIKRIQELLPKIDQGLMAKAEREGVKALGEGTPERAAYEEIQKLEGNAALQNEVAQGVKGRALGFNMVKLGQGLFASPEMTKDAQTNILNKALTFAQLGKNANEIVLPFEHYSPGTINGVKQKYYNDSLAAGAPIATQDYLSGAWKQAPAAPAGGGKVATQADIAAAAQKTGKTIDQVTQDAKAKGYVIQ